MHIHRFQVWPHGHALLAKWLVSVSNVQTEVEYLHPIQDFAHVLHSDGIIHSAWLAVWHHAVVFESREVGLPLSCLNAQARQYKIYAE